MDVTVDRLAAAPRRAVSPWVVGAAPVAIVIVHAVLLDHRPSAASRAVFTVMPMVLLGLILVVAVRRDRLLAAAALLLAVSPAALSAVAAAEPVGAVAVLWACAAIVVVWWWHVGAAAAVTITALAALITTGWWISDSTGPAASTAIGAVLTSTGDLLRSAVGTLGGNETLVPTTGWLAGWVAVGVLVGAAIVAGDRRAAVLVPMGVAAVVVIGWSITRWRGAPALSGGTWIVAATVAGTGAVLDTRLDRAVAGRAAGALLVLAGYVNLIAVAYLARR